MDVAVTEVMIADIIDWYPGLSSHLIPSQGRRGGGRQAPGSRLPTRLDTLDLIVQIQTKSLEWEERARRMLGQNSRPNRDVTRSLNWIMVALTIIFENDDEDLFDDIQAGIHGIHRAAREVKGETVRPLRLELRCPFCTKRLHANLDRAIVYCANVSCKCASDDCGCKGNPPQNHRWLETEWPMLGLLMGTGTYDAQPV